MIKKKVIRCKLINNYNINEHWIFEIIKPEHQFNYELPSIPNIYARCEKSMELFDELSRKNIQKYKFKFNDIICINSVAGSGKTSTLLKLGLKYNKEKILYIAFNRSLVVDLEKKLKKLNIKSICPKTFDSLIRLIFIIRNKLDENI